MFSKILIASDGSCHALAAAKHAAALAKKFGSELTIVTVYNPAEMPASFMGVPGESINTATEPACYAAELQSEIEHDTGTVIDAEGLKFTCKRELGHPVDRIITVACNEDSDLIVMGCRGLSRWKSYLLGSVSDGVLHHAHCPVLIVR